MPIIPHLTHEPAEAYHAQAKEYLSSHQLADFRACPQLYYRKRMGLVTEPEQQAFAFGRAAHSLILEGPEAFAAEFAVGGPINEKTGRPYGRETKAFAEWAQTVGKPVVTEDDHAMILRMRESVRTHPVAALLLCHGIAEGVIRHDYAGVPCQIRCDWVSGEFGLVDLKTCADLSAFEYDARKFRYIHQLAFYRAVIREATGELPQVHIVAVEKREPYRCGVWRIDEASLDGAERENYAAIARLRQCWDMGEWPTGYEQTRVLELRP